MKRYMAKVKVIEYYDVPIDALDEDDAWDMAEQLDDEEIKYSGDFVEIDREIDSIDLVDFEDEE